MSDPGGGRVVIVMSDAPTSAPGVLSVPVPPGYTNHIGSGRDGAGNVFWAVTVDGPNSGDVDVAILRRDVGTGEWQQIWTWDEQTYGKHGYGTLQPLPDGSLSCGLSERNDQNQTVAIERIVPAEYARAVWAVGSYVVAPGGVIRLLTVANFDGLLSIPLAPRGIPPDVQWLNVKLTVMASAIGRRGYVGGVNNVFGMLTCATQAPGIRNYSSGIVAPSADGTLIVRTETGLLNEIHVDIAGWHY